MELKTEVNHTTPDEECAVMNSPELIMFRGNPVYNRRELALGVEREKCVYVGPLEGNEPIYGGLEQMGLYVSSVEKYANGAMNVYVKNLPGKPAVGFIRVR